MLGSMNSIEALIASHRAAVAAVDRLKDDINDGELTVAVAAETSAVQALVEAPCDDDAFFTKLSYLLAENTRTAGPPDIDNGFGALALAVFVRLSELGV